MSRTERWARTVAATIAVAALIAAVMYVTRPLRRDPLIGAGPTSRRTGWPEINEQALTEAARHSRFLGPVPFGEVLTVPGDPGFAAQLSLTRGGRLGEVTYTIHLRNIGTQPMAGLSSANVWARTKDGDVKDPSDRRPATIPAIAPGVEADQVLEFSTWWSRPARLDVVLGLGDEYVSTEWTLTS